ncbi:MAG: HAMP domain-containing protein [Micromonosporaceae bacterium]|nr:HAMP domain-containing protein [Micromonosporaceae bacterium]
MRQRLAAIYVLLLIMVLAGLEVPLAITLASRDTQQMTLDRLSDAVRFATIAEPALRAGDVEPIKLELATYRELYRIEAAVVNLDHRAVVGTDRFPVLRGVDDPVEQALERALQGEQVGAKRVILPWQTEPLVVAAPVGTGGAVLGAVVTVSPTGQTRSAITDGWLMLGALGLIALAVSVVAAEALARWTLKPVEELDAAAHLITEGDYEARVPAYLGPPELRRLATAFNEMADNVGDALERQRMFVSQASHQLRNPLHALQLRVEGLGEEMSSEQGLAEHQVAMAETERLSRILDSLLALARAERGRYQMESVDAVRVAMDRVAAWRPLAEQRRITLQYAASHVPVWVAVLSTGLDQALDALIDNALKFVAPAGRVDVSVHAEQDRVIVHVVDNGPGLTAEQRRKATDRFWRAPSAQNVDGSGLGLPIVAVLVEASGGSFDLLPATPYGLDARLTLKAARDPSS